METLHSNKLSKQTTTSSTQQFLDVAEIKEDTIILRNGALRAVLAVSAINFDLKSTEEQEAIISQYQNFINSVDFPVQVLINSRKLDMNNYLGFLTEKEKEQSNELLRFQISEYRNFIGHLVEVSNIMNKNFYIIVPFSPIENTEKGVIAKIFSTFNPKKDIIEKREMFETMRSQLIQRADQVIAGLSGIGLRIIPLIKTEELIELLFNAYNPSVFSSVDLKDINKLELIK